MDTIEQRLRVEGSGGILPYLQLGFDDRKPRLRIVNGRGDAVFAAPGK